MASSVLCFGSMRRFSSKMPDIVERLGLYRDARCEPSTKVTDTTTSALEDYLITESQDAVTVFESFQFLPKPRYQRLVPEGGYNDERKVIGECEQLITPQQA